MSAIPAFAPFPPATIRLGLGPQEWETFLDAWITLAELCLTISDAQFATVAISNDLIGFLKSFYGELVHATAHDSTLRSPKAASLCRKTYLLTRRCSTVNEVSILSSDLDFLSHFAKTHAKNFDLPSLLLRSWNAHESSIQTQLQKWQQSLIKQLESSSPDSTTSELNDHVPLFHGCPDMAMHLVTGSDFIDASVAAYARTRSQRLHKALIATVYLGLVACVRSEHTNFAILSDHLYMLRAHADDSKSSPSLLADLVTNTPLINKLRLAVSASPHPSVTKLLDSIATYRSPSIARPRKRPHKKADKGKSRQTGNHHDMHIHRMSLVSQVQDLFPDLGAGFVLRLLDEYGDDVEQATAHLLDHSLPPALQALDRQAQAPIFDADQYSVVEHLAPRSTPPLPASFIPDRKNAFDDDEMDHLELGTSQLHIGKRNDKISSSSLASKSAIMAALAAFDADDDERDDTYDVEDVGGTVDAAHHDGDDNPVTVPDFDENDMTLFKVLDTTPESFGRTADIRRSKPRAALKERTGMTDEAIEGWAIMLQRDPRRMRRLALHASQFDGRQTDIPRTAYRDTEADDSDAPADRLSGVRGRGHGRGRGARGRGRGGNVAGPSSDPNTAAVQRRKEADKGSRANHNRRDQRAKKMARGGFSA